MGRFSPRVLPEYGPSFAEALIHGLSQGVSTYQGALAQKSEAAERDRRRALENMALAQQGVHLGEAPPPIEVQGLAGIPDPEAMLTPGAFNIQTGGFNPGRVETRTRNLTTFDGGYIDHDAVEQRQSQAFQRQLAEALAMKDAMRPGELGEYRQRKAIDREYEAPPPPRALSQVDRGNAIDLIDPVTGETRRTLGKQASPKAPGESGQRDFSNAAQLRSQYNGEQTVKDAAQVAASATTVTTALAQRTAAGDMAGIFAFMKALDPGSTVREGEYANAQNAAGIPERVRNAFNKAKDGQILDDNQRRDFLTTVQQMAASRRAALRGVNKRYSEIAGRYQVDPRDVVYDPFEDSRPNPYR